MSSSYNITQQDIKDWEDNNINDLITDTKSLDDLETQWNRWNQMTYKQRRVSDWEAQKIYGMTNKEYYESIKSKLLKNDETDVPIESDDNSSLTANTEASITTINTSAPVRDLKIIYDSKKIEQAKTWQNDSSIIIIIPQPTQSQLEELWNKWNQMILKQRRISNWKSVEIFGIDNKTHYEYLKSHFLEKNVTDVDLDSSGEDNIIPDVSKDDESIKDYVETINTECAKINPNTLKIASMCMDLSRVPYNLLSEKVLINRTVDSTIEFLRNNTNKIPDYIDAIPNSLPYFTPVELIDMGVYRNDLSNLYSDTPDNSIICDNVLTKEWFEEYKSFMSGYMTNKFKDLLLPWVHKLEELYLDFNNIKESGDINKINARKQSILELGWNPEINFDNVTRTKVTNKMKSMIEENNNIDIIDISPLINENDIINTITESSSEPENGLYPVFIVLVYTGSAFGKLIVKYTDAVYSHSAIGFEPDLQRLYSYNLSKIYNSGLSFESLEQYKRDSDMSKLAVFAMFVTKKDLIKLKSRLDYFIANAEHTKYSIRNIFGILTNNPINMNLKMICSQFVDSMLKSIDVNITGKDSALTVPNDFANVINPRVYKIFEGDAKSYDAIKVKKTLNTLQKNAKYIKESHTNIINENMCIESICRNINNLDSLLSLNEKSDVLTGKAKYIYEEFIEPRLTIKPVRETKEFPVQFDNDGNLLIKKYKTLDFESEYAQSHKLLLSYEKNRNLEGVKYELSKLWFMNNILESKLYKSKDADKYAINKARAKILNDFNKYLSFINQNEENFNFIAYYNETPFSDVKIKINRSTLKYTGELIKQILL